MNRILGIVAVLSLALPGMAWAADCDISTNQPAPNDIWSVVRMVVDDDIDATGQSATCTVPSLAYDYITVYIEHPDTCTSLTVDFETQFTSTTSECEGTCDWHDMTTSALDESGTTAESIEGPIGETIRADTTAFGTCANAKAYVEFRTRKKR